MKINLIPYTLVLLTCFGHFAEAEQLRLLNVSMNRRELGQHFNFLVSDASSNDQPLCLTAIEGTTGYGDLELQFCDFEQSPPEQLWRRLNDKLVSGVGIIDERCITVNHGNKIFNGVRMRLGNCVDYQTDFIFDNGRIKVLGADSYCITMVGSSPSAGDKIHAKPCQNRLDFDWTFTPSTTTKNDPYPTESPYGRIYNLFVPEINACVQPPKSTDNDVSLQGSEVVIDKCDGGRAWYAKVNDWDEVVFRSVLDPGMCLQAGFCRATDGSWLRVMPCDEESGLQYFTWPNFDGLIKLADQPDLCMVFHGSVPEIGAIMKLKSCDVRSYEWSGNMS